MIKALAESENAVLGVEITGKVTLTEEKQWIGVLEQLIQEHGQISALVVLGEQASWGLEAGLEDLKWIMTHMNKINRIAIVSKSSALKWFVALDRPFAKLFDIDEKYFDVAELAEAWQWVKQ